VRAIYGGGEHGQFVEERITSTSIAVTAAPAYARA
jgi:hypothetical protein